MTIQHTHAIASFGYINSYICMNHKISQVKSLLHRILGQISIEIPVSGCNIVQILMYVYTCCLSVIFLIFLRSNLIDCRFMRYFIKEPSNYECMTRTLADLTLP